MVLMGKEGKVTTGGYKEMRFFESYFIVACTGMMYLLLVEGNKKMMVMRVRC